MDSNRYKDLIYWVALADNELIGSKTILKLDKYFGSLKKLFITRDLSGLSKLNIRKEIRVEIRKIVNNYNSKILVEKYQKLGIKVVCIKSGDYPKLLQEISDPPAVLFYKGKMGDGDELGLAVVGSRKYSNYGKQVVHDIVHNLAKENITIVSGMALGIDSLAHKTTLEAKGRTIGVLANGLDMIYPSSNRALAEGILANDGLLVSENPPGTPPYKSNFPLRNRIIAGMSLGTLVIEAARKSGTLLTAKAALDYNRELFAIPGNIFSPTSEGANNLIKYGAKLVNDSQDILKELNIETKVKCQKAQKVLPSSKEEVIILELLHPEEPVHVDKIVKKSKLDVSVVSSKLIFMEMKGMVKNIGANNYIAI